MPCLGMYKIAAAGSFFVTISCGICGYHVYNEVWSPNIGENFVCFNEVENDHVTHCTHKQRTVNVQCQDHRGQVAIGVDAATKCQ